MGMVCTQPEAGEVKGHGHALMWTLIVGGVLMWMGLMGREHGRRAWLDPFKAFMREGHV